MKPCSSSSIRVLEGCLLCMNIAFLAWSSAQCLQHDVQTPQPLCLTLHPFRRWCLAHWVSASAAACASSWRRAWRAVRSSTRSALQCAAAAATVMMKRRRVRRMEGLQRAAAAAAAAAIAAGSSKEQRVRRGWGLAPPTLRSPASRPDRLPRVWAAWACRLCRCRRSCRPTAVHRCHPVGMAGKEAHGMLSMHAHCYGMRHAEVGRW